MSLIHRLLLFALVSVVTMSGIPPNAAASCEIASETRRIFVRDFQKDSGTKLSDGSALRAALKKAVDSDKPVAVILETGKTYRITTYQGNYALKIHKAKDLQLIGGGSLLLLTPPHRLIEVSDSTNVTLCNFALDYSPLPFTQGTVIGLGKLNDYFDVEIESGFYTPSANDDPGRFGNRGWEFAIPFNPPSDYRKRINIRSITPLEAPNKVRVHTRNPKHRLNIRRGTRIILPVPGKGQTGNFTVQILRNSGVHIQDVTIFSAPQGTFYVADNLGNVHFQNISQIQPENSNRLMTGWRGIFHVKDNRAPITWDSGHLTGAFDDAININSMYQLVIGKTSNRKWIIRDLGKDAPTEFRAGDKVRAVALTPNRKVIGEVVIKTAEKSGRDQIIGLSPDLDLVPGGQDCVRVKALCGSRIINLSTSNPGSSIQNMQINGSVRLRGSVRVNNIELNGVLQLTSSPTREGPSPENILISNSILKGKIKIGSDANPQTTIENWTSGERWAKDITFQDNVISARFKIEGASVRLIDNELIWPTKRRFMVENSTLEIKNLRRSGEAVKDVQHLIQLDSESAPSQIRISE